MLLLPQLGTQTIILDLQLLQFMLEFALQVLVHLEGRLELATQILYYSVLFEEELTHIPHPPITDPMLHDLGDPLQVKLAHLEDVGLGRVLARPQRLRDFVLHHFFEEGGELAAERGVFLGMVLEGRLGAVDLFLGTVS